MIVRIGYYLSHVWKAFVVAAVDSGADHEDLAKKNPRPNVIFRKRIACLRDFSAYVGQELGRKESCKTN